MTSIWIRSYPISCPSSTVSISLRESALELDYGPRYPPCPENWVDRREARSLVLVIHTQRSLVVGRRAQNATLWMLGFVRVRPRHSPGHHPTQGVHSGPTGGASGIKKRHTYDYIYIHI